MNASVEDLHNKWRAFVAKDAVLGEQVGELQRTTGYIDRYWWRTHDADEQAAMDEVQARRKAVAAERDSLENRISCHPDATSGVKVRSIDVFQPTGIAGIIVRFDCDAKEETAAEREEERLRMDSIRVQLCVGDKTYSTGSQIHRPDGSLDLVDGGFAGVCAPRGVRFQGVVTVKTKVQVSFAHLSGKASCGVPVWSPLVPGPTVDLDFGGTEAPAKIEKHRRTPDEKLRRATVKLDSMVALRDRLLEEGRLGVAEHIQARVAAQESVVERLKFEAGIEGSTESYSERMMALFPDGSYALDPGGKVVDLEGVPLVQRGPGLFPDEDDWNPQAEIKSMNIWLRSNGTGLVRVPTHDHQDISGWPVSFGDNRVVVLTQRRPGLCVANLSAEQLREIKA